MAMRAATVEVLIEKARFEPRVAVAIAEAMDEALESRARHLQPVTVPLFETLDGKVVALDGKLVALDGKVIALDGRLTVLDGKVTALDGRLTALDGKVTALDGRLTTLDGKVTALDGKLTALDGRLVALDSAQQGLRDKMDRDKVELMRWTLLTMMSLFAMITGMMYFMLQQFR